MSDGVLNIARSAERTRKTQATAGESPFGDLEIAVLVPCLNEAGAIGQVAKDFQDALPSALVYVYDNGSTDDTMAEARAAGAIVRSEPRRGKGNVVRR